MTTVSFPVFERPAGGAPPRYICDTTAQLGALSKQFEDLQGSRKRASQRGFDALADELRRLEDRTSRQLARLLRSHPVWPWLEPLKGLSGALSGHVLGMIQDPLRFPGQPCSLGHIIRPGWYAAGEPCPISRTTETADESEIHHGCAGVLLAPRTTTGARSLIHYAGLHVTGEGKLPQRRKGQMADWKPDLRAVCLKPDGIADQIVKHRTPRYRDVYDQVREAKLLVDYPKWRAHKIGRTVAAKTYLKDLLTEWKRVAS